MEDRGELLKVWELFKVGELLEVNANGVNARFERHVPLDKILKVLHEMTFFTVFHRLTV